MGRVSSHAVSSWTRSPSCCGFRGVFWVGRIFPCFFFFRFFFSSNAHGLLQVRGRLASFASLLVPGTWYMMCALDTRLKHFTEAYVLYECYKNTPNTPNTRVCITSVTTHLDRREQKKVRWNAVAATKTLKYEYGRSGRTTTRTSPPPYGMQKTLRIAGYRAGRAWLVARSSSTNLVTSSETPEKRCPPGRRFDG